MADPARLRRAIVRYNHNRVHTESAVISVQDVDPATVATSSVVNLENLNAAIETRLPLSAAEVAQIDAEVDMLWPGTI